MITTTIKKVKLLKKKKFRNQNKFQKTFWKTKILFRNEMFKIETE